MRKIVLIGLIALIVLISGCTQVTPTPEPPTEIPEIELKSCSVDSDCVLVQGDCCPCGLGTKAINKNYEETWETSLEAECSTAGTICPAFCNTGLKDAICTKNQCEGVPF